MLDGFSLKTLDLFFSASPSSARRFSLLSSVAC
jgi:hypothetical protein